MNFSQLLECTERRVGRDLSPCDVDVITDFYRDKDPEIREAAEAGANGISLRCMATDKYEADVKERNEADKVLDRQCAMWGV